MKRAASPTMMCDGQGGHTTQSSHFSSCFSVSSAAALQHACMVCNMQAGSNSGSSTSSSGTTGSSCCRGYLLLQILGLRMPAGNMGSVFHARMLPLQERTMPQQPQRQIQSKHQPKTPLLICIRSFTAATASPPAAM